MIIVRFNGFIVLFWKFIVLFWKCFVFILLICLFVDVWFKCGFVMDVEGCLLVFEEFVVRFSNFRGLLFCCLEVGC